jgi:flavin reductase (DIM6/NTAB) family NADH-FMN oxidoreductase RutF
MPIDTMDLRRCLGQFATGVTVVTCAGSKGEACGITANSFSSVSLDPPLVLWNIAKTSGSLDAYLNAEHFAFNVLSAEQQDISSHFAQSDHTLFADVEHEVSDKGVPLLTGTLACFECRTYEIHDCGDHYIIIGEIERFRKSNKQPLLFFNSSYATIRT